MPDRPGGKPPRYTVGFGRPPKAAQFKAGTSGNPRGRPKGTRGVGAVLRAVIRQRIAVTENGRTRRLGVLEIVLRRLANDAMRSDVKALKLLLALVERYAESPEVESQIEDILAQDREILKRFLGQPKAGRNPAISRSRGGKP
jgi:hypothetical protein